MVGLGDSTAGWNQTDLAGAVFGVMRPKCSVRMEIGMWRRIAAICLCLAVTSSARSFALDG